MERKDKYDLLIIGGGISACVFAANYFKNNTSKRISIIEAGRSLGGRASTRKSRRFKDWEINHGAPNINITNNKNNPLLKNFIKELKKNNIIKFDDSDLIHLGYESNQEINNNLDFDFGRNYISSSSMSDLSYNIISLNNAISQIDFYFETLIVDLIFINNEWILISKSGEIFKSHYLVCSSNLLLHKRSMKILNKNQIPIRKAIPQNNDETIDLLLNSLNQQLYIPRVTFLIYSNKNYFYKDSYSKEYRYFYLNKVLEDKYKLERVIFQLQKNNKLGIVLHSKNKDFIDSYFQENREINLERKILKNFNDLFKNNSFINQLSGDEIISIMRWRASQPIGERVPLNLQISKDYKIGFCGDWFDVEGFGRIEGAILSGLELAKKFNSLIQ